MKTHKCIKCDTITTRQEDGICVVCKIGVTQMHAELVDLLKKNKMGKRGLGLSVR